MHNSFTSIIERYPGKGGWYFLELPERPQLPPGVKNRYGFVPIIATISSVSWGTSLLPGHGKYFIALKKDIRNKLRLDVGMQCEVNWELSLK